MNKPKRIGTAAESAVTKFLRTNGFPHAERRALTGAYDQGDITGCPGLVFEVKGGEAARTASDGQVEAWLAETETERINAGADLGILVMQRRGVGPANAGRWWAVMRLGPAINNEGAIWKPAYYQAIQNTPVRLLLGDAVTLLRAAGYGQPLLTDEEVA
jgi:hypothetical protein